MLFFPCRLGSPRLQFQCDCRVQPSPKAEKCEADDERPLPGAAHGHRLGIASLSPSSFPRHTHRPWLLFLLVRAALAPRQLPVSRCSLRGAARRAGGLLPARTAGSRGPFHDQVSRKQAVGGEAQSEARGRVPEEGLIGVYVHGPQIPRNRLQRRHVARDAMLEQGLRIGHGWGGGLGRQRGCVKRGMWGGEAHAPSPHGVPRRLACPAGLISTSTTVLSPPPPPFPPKGAQPCIRLRGRSRGHRVVPQAQPARRRHAPARCARRP